MLQKSDAHFYRRRCLKHLRRGACLWAVTWTSALASACVIWFAASSSVRAQVADRGQGTVSQVDVPSTDSLNLAEDIWPIGQRRRTGDLNQLIESGEIRIVTTMSLGFYFIDAGMQEGATYEIAQQFEEFVRKELGDKAKGLRIVIIPARRDQLLQYLQEGYGDVVAAQLRISPELEKEVDFARPFFDKHRQFVVTGPETQGVLAIEDLSGHEIVVRVGSSHVEALSRLNTDFTAKGLAPVAVTVADPDLETEDLLEMVNAGLLPATVADGFRTKLWTAVFEDLHTNDALQLGSDGELALAIRKDSPQLNDLLDRFIEEHKVGGLVANVIVQRYRDNTNWTANALKRNPFRGLEDIEALFRKYGEEYGFDWLMLACLAIQESALDQSVRSAAGAVGIMQVLPSTAADQSVGIGDIEVMENNVHAGTKYLALLRDSYFNDPGLDDFQRTLFSLAGYNAGPNRINRLREVATDRGLDPDIWFNNVELVVAAEVGLEPVRYVGNIYKYYLAYQRVIASLSSSK